MGYAGKIHERLLARKLRQKGLSIREIQDRLKVSKSSVSLWVRDIRLTNKQRNRLYRNAKTGALRGVYIAAENKKRRREIEERTLYHEGKIEIGRLTKRNVFIAGIALYFAEGDKRGHNIAFSNSDPRAIRFMMNWFRKFLDVPEGKFRLYLYLHDDLDEERAKRFWLNLTKLPPLAFGKTYIVQAKQHRLRQTRHMYGVLRISFADVQKFRKLMGWIGGVLGDKIDE